MIDTPTIERWCTCRDYPDYSVSDQGRVRRDKPGPNTYPGRIKTTRISGRGARVVTLYCDGRATNSVDVTSLVAKAFLPSSGPDVECVIHLDGDKSNARLDNLQWSTWSGCLRKTYATRVDSKLGSDNGRARLNEPQVRMIRRAVKLGVTRVWIGSILGLSKNTINAAVRGRTWGHVVHGGPLVSLAKHRC